MIDRIILENIKGFRDGTYLCHPKITIFTGNPGVINLHSILAYAFKIHDNRPTLKKEGRFLISVLFDNGSSVIRTNNDHGLFVKKGRGIEKIQWPDSVNEEQFDSLRNWDWPGSMIVYTLDRLTLMKEEKFKFILVRSLDIFANPNKIITRIANSYPKQVITTMAHPTDLSEYVRSVL